MAQSGGIVAAEELLAAGAGVNGVAAFGAGGGGDGAGAGLMEGDVLLPGLGGIAAAGGSEGIAKIGVLGQKLGIVISTQRVALAGLHGTGVHAAEGAAAAGDRAGAVAVGDGHDIGHFAGHEIRCALGAAADAASVAAAGNAAGVIAAVDGAAISAAAKNAARVGTGGGDAAGVIAARDGVSAANKGADDAAHVAAAGNAAEVGAVSDGAVGAGITHDAAHVVAIAADGHIAEAVFDGGAAAAGVAGDGAACGGDAAQGQILDVRAAADLAEQALLGVQAGDLKVLAVQLHLLAGGHIQPRVFAQVDAGGQHAGDVGGLALVHEPGQLRAGADLIDAVNGLGLDHGGAVPCGVGGDGQGDGEHILTVLRHGDGAGGVLHARAHDDIGILLSQRLEGAVLFEGNGNAVAVLHGDSQILAVDGAAVTALEDQLAGQERGLGHGDADVRQPGQDAGSGGCVEAGVRAGGIGDAAVGGDARIACLLDSAGQGIGGAVPILGNGDGDLLTGGVAAEVIYAEAAAGIGLEEGAVLALIVQGEVEVIRAGQLLLGADETVVLQIDGVAGLDVGLGLVGQDCAVGVHQIIADAARGDHLIVGRAVLGHLDNVAAGGQTGDGNGAVGGDADAAAGEAVEGHGVTHGGAGHGDGAAFFGLEAVGRALAAQIEQDVMLGIQRVLLVLGDVGVHAIQHHVGLDAGAVAAHGDDEHAGQLRPDGGKLAVGRVAGLALHVDHGVIGHQHDGGAFLVGGHGGHIAVLLVGGNGQHVAGVAVDVDDLIVHVGQRHLGVHEALDGEPVAEGVQLEGLAHGHALIALGVDVQIDAAAVVDVLVKAVDRILVEGFVADMEIVLGQCYGGVLLPAGVIPIGDAVGILHAVEVGGALIHAELDTGLGLHGIKEAEDVVFGQRAYGNGGALRYVEGDGHAGLAGGGEGVGAGRCFLDLCDIFVGVLFRIGGKGGLHGVAHHEDAAGVGLFPGLTLAAGGGAERDGTHLVVSGGDLQIDGIIFVLHPAGVAERDLIDALDLEAGMLLIHGDGQAAVEIVVCVIALHPVLTGGQGQGIGAVRRGDVGQQVGLALHAVEVGVELQGLDLRVMQTAEGDFHGLTRGDGLHGGVHDHGGLSVIGTRRRQVALGGRGHGDDSRAVIVGNGAVDLRQLTGSGVDPCQLNACQRLGGGLQLGGSLVQVTHQAIGDAGDGHGFAVLTQIDPGVVVGPGCVILIDKEVHDIVVIDFGGADKGAVVAAPLRRCAIIGIALIDNEAVGVCLDTEQLGDSSACADDQVFAGGVFGEVAAEHQLLRLDQSVQRGNAVHLIREAVLFRQIGGDAHSVNAMEISAGRLRADGDVGGGDRLTGGLDRNGIGFRGNTVAAL